ncbi:MAG: hypothetical protein L3J35_03315 [Bacteroidales bacterium]|nr:hypothetical protein [Bacteroidales bacterium]
MKNFIIILVAGFLFSCGGSSEVDQTKPESILNAVFSAANSGDYALLKDFCDPKGEGDKDVQMICEVAAENADKELISEFKKYFSKGKITGEVDIEKDDGVEYAELPFSFGPNGDKKEVMVLVKREGNWYLYSF